MMWTALLVLVSAAAGEPAPAGSRGAELATARATVQILRPAIVRQSSGWQEIDPDAPRPQINRRRGQILVEYQ